MNRKRSVLLCLILAVAEAVNIFFIIRLADTISGFNIIPSKYLILLISLFALSVVLPIITFFTTIKKQKKAALYKCAFIISCILMVLSITVCATGNHYLKYGSETLRKVTSVKSKKSTYGVYKSTNTQNTKDETQPIKKYLIITGLDETNTSRTVAMIEEELGSEIEIETYDNISNLLGAMEEEGSVAILNTAYVDMFSEIEGYEELEDSIKLVAEYEIVDTLKGTSALSEREPIDPGEPFLMYISGIDVWGHITEVSRSDVNILMAVNPQTHQILLVNTPRDYYVPLSISNGMGDKLTHAGIYGVDVSIETLEMLYDIDIDYYFKLNFSGFEGLIDALGGITVWSDYDFTVDPIKHYVVGDNELTGLEALAFARERYSFEEGDRQRGINQMNVIQSVVDKLTSSALIKNYQEIMDQLEGTFATDMSIEEIADFVRTQLEDGRSWNIQKYSVTGWEDMQPTYSVGSDTQLFVLQPDYDSVAEGSRLLKEVLAGEQ